MPARHQVWALTLAGVYVLPGAGRLSAGGAGDLVVVDHQPWALLLESDGALLLVHAVQAVAPRPSPAADVKRYGGHVYQAACPERLVRAERARGAASRVGCVRIRATAQLHVPCAHWLPSGGVLVRVSQQDSRPHNRPSARPAAARRPRTGSSGRRERAAGERRPRGPGGRPLPGRTTAAGGSGRTTAAAHTAAEGPGGRPLPLRLPRPRHPGLG